jgi:hypothetical protein
MSLKATYKLKLTGTGTHIHKQTRTKKTSETAHFLPVTNIFNERT